MCVIFYLPNKRINYAYYIFSLMKKKIIDNISKLIKNYQFNIMIL